MAHHRPRQLERLVRVLQAPGRPIVLHVDVNAPSDVHDAAAVLAGTYADVRVISPQACRWGGWSLVEVQLAATRELLRSDSTWRHVINLSGSDFPLRPMADIDAELATMDGGVNLIDWFDPVAREWINPWFDEEDRRRHDTMSRVTHVYPELRGRQWKGHLPVVRRRLPGGAKWYGGSQWSVLSRDFAQHLVEDRVAQRLAGFFRFTFIPDESFVQTVALNSEFRDTVVNDNRRLIEWEPGVRVWRHSDLDRLMASDAWFARKFDELVDAEVLDALERHVTRG
jgi:hypothetical protein